LLVESTYMYANKIFSQMLEVYIVIIKYLFVDFIAVNTEILKSSEEMNKDMVINNILIIQEYIYFEISSLKTKRYLIMTIYTSNI
jgi:hypothetical protein